jgi:sialate O-acetylesterase
MTTRARLRAWWCVAIMVAMAADGARGEVKPASPFADNMVLQRDRAAPVWGTAAAGEKVTVTFAGQTRDTTAGPDGRWRVDLKAMPFSTEGREVVIAGRNTVALGNVLVGDVWICAGQSNMAQSLRVIQPFAAEDITKDIAAADLPLVRFCRVNYTTAIRPRSELDIALPWTVCTPRRAPLCSAVAFYFARKVHQQTGVPLGLVVSAWGATNIEPWIGLEAFCREPELADVAAKVLKDIDDYRKRLPARMTALEAWLTPARQALATGKPLPEEPVWPIHPLMARAHGHYPRRPGSVFNAMIAPLAPYAVRGAIWYQGESNGAEGHSYYVKMRTLIGNWRSHWKQGDFPFYFVQLADWGKATNDPADGGNSPARLRMAQTKALTIPNTGMAVAIDCGRFDIHPMNKLDIGERLALWALAKDYGKKIVYSGPLFKGMTVQGHKVRVTFQHAQCGLIVGKKEGRAPVREVVGGKLKRFAIAGKDRKWVWADARIDGTTVVVSSPEAPKPVAVRYAYSLNPAGANLYNKAGLPASPFRTDDW